MLISDLKLMADNETAMGKLYISLSRRFPESAVLWKTLAEEESKHARIIMSIYDKIKKGFLKLDEGRFSVYAIQKMANTIERAQNLAGSKLMTLRKALEMCLDLEIELLEKDYFDLLKNDPDLLKKVLAQLSQGTQRHRDRIRKALQVLDQLSKC